MAAVAAALPWFVYFVGLGLNTISGTYSKVTAEGGESVIIEHSGFDRRAYSVFRQKSSFLWERSGGWHTAPDVFDPNACTLMARKEDLQLTCGTDSVQVPSHN
ncbi:hypothetical protein [Pseudarthrobacter sp. NamE5]|uniref:hypothetical protein n=1 Tax=Pseudarthrobacter sp. NamE5 TaxID=2576839 RepID=UPI00110AABE3|nr:hypothetical protein [Pseudarthrobacter sp. NamE5]TLM80835.1 hypothetical protein FDW84_18485 [Pseudarthrobacter sp. NamE5]